MCFWNFGFDHISSICHIFVLGMCRHCNGTVLGFIFQRALANMNLPTFSLRLVKPFEFGKPFSKLDLRHQRSNHPQLFPSPGMDFKIHGQNSGWLPLWLWPLSWEHWWDRVWGQSLSCGELHTSTQESQGFEADLIFSIIWIRPRHRIGYAWF